MSVNREHFAIFGWEIGYDTFDHSLHEYDEYNGGKNGVYLIADGMAGEYCYIGAVIDRSGDTRETRPSFSGTELTETTVSPAQMMELGVVREMIPEELRDPSFHVFTHVH